MLLICWLSLVVANIDDGHRESCRYVKDCKKRDCHTATCSYGQCYYERLPLDECCLTSDECCAFASEHQIGICDKNCTCQFIPALQFQCTDDAHCDETRSGHLCRSHGRCHLPICKRGFCECLDTTGMDYDGDGVNCPEDCNDMNADVQRSISCVKDADEDGAPLCDGEPATCKQLCVAQNDTCPETYLELPAPQGSLTPATEYEFEEYCENPAEEADCDCCDSDDHVFPGSTYVSNAPNECGGLDYNCDGSNTSFVCCDNPSENTMHYPRTFWHDSECTEADPEQCGSCDFPSERRRKRHIVSPDLTMGWKCVENCSVTPYHHHSYDMTCPTVCNSEVECVDESTPTVELGKCAKFVVDCRNQTAYYVEKKECCVRTVQ